MRSVYIRLRLGPAAAPLIIRMCMRLGNMAMVCDYPHPAIYLILMLATLSIKTMENKSPVFWLTVTGCSHVSLESSLTRR